MSERGLQIAADLNTDGWERTNFPIACETCLGDNPVLRMMRAHCDKECKICSRPYTVFRWQPGKRARFKQTVICQTCAKFKNVCQVCLFDMEYGLPVQVRDKFLKEATSAALPELPEHGVNRDYAIHALEKRMEGQSALPYGKAPHEMLEKLTRSSPYYKRNLPKICSFWQKGDCVRGDSCPYRHENDEHHPGLTDQNIKNRFHGKDDPVANKILNTLANQPSAAVEGGEAPTLQESFSVSLPPAEL